MAKRSKARRSTVRTWPLYLVLAIVFILYIYYRHVQSMAIILGASLFFIIIVLVVLELINSLGEKHYVRDMLELAIAIGIIVVFWFALKLVLRTGYPLDVVPSCSMLPSLHRGDMILLQGMGSMTQIKAPIIRRKRRHLSEHAQQHKRRTTAMRGL